MNFFVNKAMGIGNSGVEHAQFYRAACFDRKNIPYKYIFMELVKNIHEAMAAWKIPDNKVISMWEYFALEGDYLRQGAKANFTAKQDLLVDATNTHRIKETITSSGLKIVEHMEKSPSRKKEGLLLVSDYRVEIFDYRTNQRKIMYSYRNDPHRGRVMTNIHLFAFKGKHRFFRNEVLLQRFFFKQLMEEFPETKTIIIDRGEESEAALYDHCPPEIKLIEIVHADHLSDRDVPRAPLWNNYYEYALTHLEQVTHIVVATELQRQDLLIDFPNESEKIVTIPVGGIRDMTEESFEKGKQQAEKFVTVSRLASEKHIDLVIRAIAAAKKEHPTLSLDIYGQGGEESKLNAIIKELNAEEYIQLKGHSHAINEVYPNYDAFISGSFSEGFGLTYIEALNAGLPIVTYKARFGAMELIKEGVNGYLKDFSRNDDTYNVQQLTEGIRQLVATDLNQLKANTRKSVRMFQDSIIAEKWSELIDAL